MPNREELMKALTMCANGEPCIGKKYRTCPYSPIGKPEHYDCGAAMAAGMLALLREQMRPVKPIIERNHTGLWPLCGACEGALTTQGKYCPHCGRAVKWEE